MKGWIWLIARTSKMTKVRSVWLIIGPALLSAYLSVAKFQHRYYGTSSRISRCKRWLLNLPTVPLMLITAFVAPILIGVIWDETLSVVVWACLVKCLLGSWHRYSKRFAVYSHLRIEYQYGTAHSLSIRKLQIFFMCSSHTISNIGSLTGMVSNHILTKTHLEQIL